MVRRMKVMHYVMVTLNYNLDNRNGRGKNKSRKEE
jgi:hypothetical protein